MTIAVSAPGAGEDDRRRQKWIQVETAFALARQTKTDAALGDAYLYLLEWYVATERDRLRGSLPRLKKILAELQKIDKQEQTAADQTALSNLKKKISSL